MAAFKEEARGMKGKQGNGNKMNPGVTFPRRLIHFPPVPEADFLEIDSSPQSLEGKPVGTVALISF